MSRARPAAAAIAVVAPLVLAHAILFSCVSSDQQNGGECLKDDDCESRRCVARLCVQPGAGRVPLDSQGSSDGPGGGDTGADSGPVDTGKGESDASGG